MHYILLVKLETTTPPTSWKIKGLLPNDMEGLKKQLHKKNVMFNTGDDFLEIDIQGLDLLNLLASRDYNYRVYGQSMAIEKSVIGSRTVTVEKIAWTLGRESVPTSTTN